MTRCPPTRPRRFPITGFTLIELMIAVAVVGILAAVAMPSYRDYVVRSKLTEASNTMSAYALALGQYYQDNRTYVGSCAPSPTSNNFSYACTLLASSWTITASGSTPSTSGFTFTLNNNGGRATTSVPTGWTTSTSCWVNNRSGACQ